MSLAPDDALGDRHHALFGAIVQHFAHHESLMDGVIATLSGASATSVKLLMASLGFVQKCDALLNLMRHHDVPVAQYDRVLRFTVVPRTYIALRHDIVHSTWAASESQNVIYPKWLSHGPVESVKTETGAPFRKGRKTVLPTRWMIWTGYRSYWLGIAQNSKSI